MPLQVQNYIESGECKGYDCRAVAISLNRVGGDTRTDCSGINA